LDLDGCNPKIRIDTAVDGSEIRGSPVEVGSLGGCLGFLQSTVESSLLSLSSTCQHLHPVDKSRVKTEKVEIRLKFK